MKNNIIIFKSIFQDDNQSEFWVPFDEIYDDEDFSQTIYKGRMYQSLDKSKKMVPFHCEIFPDRLIRQDINENGENEEEEKQQKKQQLFLNSCFIKKIKIQDFQTNTYKYGIRLQRDNNKCELFAETSYIFNKWYEEIKRFCILSKFEKKYKIIQKINTQLQYKCFRFSDSSQYIVKVIDKGTISSSQEKQIIKEIRVLRRLNSQFVTKLIEVYENENNLFIITEFVQGIDMKQKLSNSMVLDEKIVSDIIWRLLSAIAHIHSKNVFHRDIKLENIQFKTQKTLIDVQLINFNTADIFNPNYPKNYKKYGTAGFIAPEIFKSVQYNQKIDVFSLGVIFYILLYGKLPFEANTIENIIRQNEKCDIDFDKKAHIIKCSISAMDLLTRMLEKDPQQRPNACDLLNHTWFVNMKNKPSTQINTMSTIAERSMECADTSMFSFFMKDNINNVSNASNHFYEQSNTVIEENSFGAETLNQKMNTLNSEIYQKVPSKYIHNLNS